MHEPRAEWFAGSPVPVVQPWVDAGALERLPHEIPGA